MIRAFVLSALLWVSQSAVAVSQDLSALASYDADDSQVTDVWRGARVELALSQGVPWRVFVLDNPRRLVADFREVDWGADSALETPDSDRLYDLRLGQFQPGWSRMVVELAAPLGLETAEMRIDEATGKARLAINLSIVSEDEFAAQSGTPASPGWAVPPAAEVAKARVRQSGQGPLTVVLDPGHGGIDPGAESGGYNEKTLMLSMARELKEQLLRTGRVNVVLTRDADVFVPLETRVAIARHAEADLFISLHADSLGQGIAHGATVYTLSDSASDEASAALAERHNRSDLLAGVELTGQGDTIANILMDLAWLDNQPRSAAMANALVLAMDQADIPLHKVPRRSAGFSVLKAPDIPSILLEVGFLSSQRDRERIIDPAWRAAMAGAITRAVLSWAETDAATGELVRQ